MWKHSVGNCLDLSTLHIYIKLQHCNDLIKVSKYRVSLPIKGALSLVLKLYRKIHPIHVLFILDGFVQNLFIY